MQKTGDSIELIEFESSPRGELFFLLFYILARARTCTRKRMFVGLRSSVIPNITSPLLLLPAGMIESFRARFPAEDPELMALYKAEKGAVTDAASPV